MIVYGIEKLKQNGRRNQPRLILFEALLGGRYTEESVTKDARFYRIRGRNVRILRFVEEVEDANSSD